MNNIFTDIASENSGGIKESAEKVNTISENIFSDIATNKGTPVQDIQTTSKIPQNIFADISTSETVSTQKPEVPFFEREGFIQRVLKPVYRFGQDIWKTDFLGAQTEQTKKDVEGLKNTFREAQSIIDNEDVPEQQKEVYRNLLLDLEPYKNLTEEPTGKQITGHIIGTAALLPLPFTKALSAVKFFGPVAEFGVVGTAMGVGEGLSEDKTLKESLKQGIETGGQTALLGAGLGLGGMAAGGISSLVRSGLTTAAETKFGQQLLKSSPAQFFRSLGERIKTFGERSDYVDELVSKFKETGSRTEIRQGTALFKAQEAGLFSIPKAERIKVQEVLAGRAEVSTLSQTERRLYDALDELRSTFGREAEELGTKLRVRGGGEVPFVTRNNYYPQFPISIDDILSKSQVYKDAIENAVKNKLGGIRSIEEAETLAKAYAEFIESGGRNKNNPWVNWLAQSDHTSVKLTSAEKSLLEEASGRGTVRGLEATAEQKARISQARDEALGIAQRYFKQGRTTKFNSMDYSREVNFPFYDPDPARAIPKYIMGASRRLEEISMWGQHSEKLNALLGKIFKKLGPEDSVEFRRLVDALFERVESTPSQQKASALLRLFSVPKLAFSQILNLGTGITNTSLASTIPTVAKGIASSFSDEGVAIALKSGATLDNVINQTIQRVGENDLSRKFLKWTGFTQTEKIVRTIAANAGVKEAEIIAKELLKNPVSEKLYKRAAELGLNPQKILSQGRLLEDDVLKAAQTFTNKTQGRARPIDLPLFASSPTGRIFFQFKNFSYNQTRFLYNELKKELVAGNYGRFTRDLFILGLLFPITGEVLADIRSLVTGSRRPTKALERYFDDLALTGAFGMYSDIVDSLNRKDLETTILGPTISSVVGLTQTTWDAIKNGKLTDAQKRQLLGMFGLSPIGNRAFPSKNKNFETFFKTLKDLAQ